MKIKINHTDDSLYCVYSKERIEVGEKYIEVVEEYIDDQIVKNYKYECLDFLVDEYLENYDLNPEIEEF